MGFKICFLIFLFIFILAISLIIAQEKSINVNVKVVANDRNEASSEDNYMGSDNSNLNDINESITTKELDFGFDNGMSGLLSVKNNSSWFIPIVLIVIAVIIIGIFNIFKRKKKIRRMKKIRHRG